MEFTALGYCGAPNNYRFKKGLDHRGEVCLWLLNSTIGYNLCLH